MDTKKREELVLLGEQLDDIHERIRLFMGESPSRFQKVDFKGIESISSNGITIRMCDWDGAFDTDFIDHEDMFEPGWLERAQANEADHNRREQLRHKQEEADAQARREAAEKETYLKLKEKFEKK